MGVQLLGENREQDRLSQGTAPGPALRPTPAQPLTFTSPEVGQEGQANPVHCTEWAHGVSAVAASKISNSQQPGKEAAKWPLSWPGHRNRPTLVYDGALFHFAGAIFFYKPHVCGTPADLR